MLTHKTTFTRTLLTATIGAVEIAMMLLTHGMVTNEGLDFFMKMTFKAVVGTGRREISLRVTRLHTAMSHRAGVRWTTTMMVLSGVRRLRIGDEGTWRTIETKAGTTAGTGSLVPKEIVGGKVITVGKRGNATDTSTDGLRTAQMMRIDLGNLDLVGILQVEIHPTVTNAAVAHREK